VAHIVVIHVIVFVMAAKARKKNDAKRREEQLVHDSTLS
jgi:hypothetical protein